MWVHGTGARLLSEDLASSLAEPGTCCVILINSFLSLGCNCKNWTRQKPGTRNYIWVSHVCANAQALGSSCQYLVQAFLTQPGPVSLQVLPLCWPGGRCRMLLREPPPGDARRPGRVQPGVQRGEGHRMWGCGPALRVPRGGSAAWFPEA